MPWSSGNFVRSNGVNSGDTTWADDEAASVGITADRHDTHDEDLADGIDNCLTKDGQNAATGNLPMGAFKHTNVGEATARTHYARASQAQDSSLIYAGTTGGTATAQTASLTPAITAYVDGMLVEITHGTTIGTAATLNINGVGAKQYTLGDGVNACAAGTLRSGTRSLLSYRSSNLTWAVLSNSGWGNATSWTPTYTGSGSVAFVASSTYAKYWIVGNTVNFSYGITGTISGTGTAIYLSIPVNAASPTANAPYAANCVNGGTTISGIGYVQTASTIAITRGDVANWTTGASMILRGNGSYEAEA